MSNLSILNTSIRTHESLFSLNDLHAASGNDPKHRPTYFIKNQQTQDLITEIERCENSNIALKVIKGGRDLGVQGTYACEELVLSYAMWISPKFHLVVLRAFLNLHKNSTALLPNTITPEQQQAIQSAVQQAHHRTSLHWQEIYRQLKSAFKVAKYDQIPQSQFGNAMGVHYEFTTYCTSTGRRKIYFRFNKRRNLKSYSIVILARSDELVIRKTG